MNYILNNILIGCLVLGGISIISKIPIIGFFTWLITIGAWIWLASRVVTTGKNSLARSESPRIPAMSWSALVGFVSGFAQSLVSLIINLITMAGASSAMQHNDAAAFAGLGASFGALWSIAGLFIWSTIGAIVCGLAGLLFGGRLESHTNVPQNNE